MGYTNAGSIDEQVVGVHHAVTFEPLTAFAVSGRPDRRIAVIYVLSGYDTQRSLAGITDNALEVELDIGTPVLIAAAVSGHQDGLCAVVPHVVIRIVSGAAVYSRIIRRGKYHERKRFLGGVNYHDIVGIRLAIGDHAEELIRSGLGYSDIRGK